ncbi:hypothetical protein CTEN210_09037 [Chaetoceros tenuissimus]|uniref:G-protein coupled receptors family 1 profile domain-containing protein n=1 Tax=Chaetoceros tenuissimus TaxID=426638 RepID=A0AAD3H6Z6_9STRA|nr:hypothetical protein CTEN210_09037 [Chaetoceros tenuissimus]
MASQVWIKSAALQVSSGAVSFICSSTLAYYMIKFKRNGLQTPYRRLIFAISVADMMQSISIVLGPFFNDSTVPQAFWAIGNASTCRLDGLLFALGNTASPMYSCFLTVYYYCKLYKKMPNERFAQQVEKWINLFILLFLMVTNIYALGTNSFNSSSVGQFCLYAVTPAGCRQQPDLYGECESSPDPDAIAILSILTSVFIPIACLMISVVLLSILLWKIVLNEKIFSLRSTSARNEIANDAQNEDQTVQQNSVPNESITAEIESGETTSSSNGFRRGKSRIANRLLNLQNQGIVRILVKNLRLRTRGSNLDESTGTASRAYRQEMTVQLILYCCSFLLSYLLFAIVQVMLLMKTLPSLTLYFTTKTLLPLQGLFNIIIFLRPAVRVTRIKRPGTCWIKAYYLVIKNGGESLQERSLVTAVLPQVPIEYPSVQFGVENYVSPWIQSEQGLEDVSKECMYVESSMELSIGNAAFNHSQGWNYVKGGESKDVNNIEDALAGIHHNGLDAIVEDEDDNEEDKEAGDVTI